MHHSRRTLVSSSQPPKPRSDNIVPMDVTEALLDSWDRQCRIVNAVAGRIDDSNKDVKPSDDGMDLITQLAHMFAVRKYFLGQLDKELQAALPKLSDNEWGPPTADLETVKDALAQSGESVRQAVGKSLEGGVQKAGWYDNAVLYLQHMVWHEGWHVGLIYLGLRLAGQEPPEEWDEKHVWGEWRTEEW